MDLIKQYRDFAQSHGGVDAATGRIYDFWLPTQETWCAGFAAGMAAANAISVNRRDLILAACTMQGKSAQGAVEFAAEIERLMTP